MKIDNSIRPVASDAGAAKGVPQRTDAPAKTPAESVQISTSAQLRAMEASMASTPVVNLDRVNQIKQAISEGRFKINPEAISGKLISSIRDLLVQSKNA